MEPRVPERFVDVDISQPGEERLIQEERLQHAAATLKGPGEPLACEIRRQRLRADSVQDAFGAVCQHPSAELARVRKHEDAPAVEAEPDPDVRVVGRIAVRHPQPAGHAQVDQERQPLGEAHDNILSASLDGQNSAAGDLAPKLVRRHAGDGAMPEHVSGAHRPFDNAAAQKVANDGFYLGQFWHGSVRLTVDRAHGRRHVL